MSAGDDPDRVYHPPKAYKNERFLNSRSARSVRILSEYVEPAARFNALDVADTVVFFGSNAACRRPANTAATLPVPKWRWKCRGITRMPANWPGV